jgi:hypothetical protein
MKAADTKPGRWRCRQPTVVARAIKQRNLTQKVSPLPGLRAGDR